MSAPSRIEHRPLPSTARWRWPTGSGARSDQCSRCSATWLATKAPRCAHRALRAARRVGGRLQLQLGVQLGAGQHDISRDPQPEEHDHHGPERAVGHVVGAEVADIEREADRGRDPHQRRHHRSGRDPSPFGLAPRGAEAIDRWRELAIRNSDQEREAHDPDQDRGAEAQGEQAHHRRHDDDRGQRRHEPDDPADGEGDGDEVEADEAPLLVLLIGDVQGGEQRLGPRRGAPERDQEADDDPPAHTPAREARELVDPAGDHAVGGIRQVRAHRLQLALRRRRVGHERVDRDEDREGREEGQEPIERAAGGHHADIVTAQFARRRA